VNNKQQLLARQADLRASLDGTLARVQDLAATNPPGDDDWKAYGDVKAEYDAIGAKLASIAKLEAETLEAERRKVPYGAAGRVEDNGAARPWGSFGEFLGAVAAAASAGGSRDPRLAQNLAPSGASESVPADGGYLVGTEFSTDLFRRTYEQSVLASRCQQVPITAPNGSYSRPYVDETSRADGSRYGGVRVYRAAEGDTVTATKPTFGRLELKLEKLIGLAYATEENLADAAQLGAIFSEAFASEMAFKLDTEIFEGNGTGQCLGIKTTSAKVSVAKETSQAAATLLAANIDKMWARMWARSRANAVWIINQDVEPQLWSLTRVVKNVAGTENVGGAPVYVPVNGLSGSPFATLLGRPVIPIEQCATIGTQGDIALVDMSQYVLISKGGIKADSSMHVRFLYDEMAFRWTYRVNGAPIWKSALTPKNGSNTLSPFVFLDTRA
jgi:HK97 family phage major capsid protein